MQPEEKGNRRPFQSSADQLKDSENSLLFFQRSDFFVCFFLAFLYSSSDFPMEKKVISLQVITIIETKTYFCFFLKNCGAIIEHAKLIFTPFLHYSCYN